MMETNVTRRNTVWIKATAGGASMLIPARKYPAWVRHALTWGTVAPVVVVLALPGALPALRERTLGRTGAGKADSQVARTNGTAEEEAEDHPVARIAVAAVAGTLLYGIRRFSFWADGAAERRLHRMGVKCPRVVMSIGVAASIVAMDALERRAPHRADRT